MSSQEPVRPIAEILPSRETIEGAGVHLRRAFGHQEVPRLDPFLLLDDFRSENPAEFVAGFPWHPHRGIETVTYMLDGAVEHEDSLGNRGVIGSGDVQWMTAGSGIIHQEMPKPLDDRMGGFQLWVNLPRAEKMTAPRYQEVRRAGIPEVAAGKGVTARVIIGDVNGVRGPVRDIRVEPEYLDLRLQPHSEFAHPVKRGHTAFAYVLSGKGRFAGPESEVVGPENLVIFRDGDEVRVRSEGEALRFLLVSGKPLGEPVAWWGPIVMNTQRELETAVAEYHEGTFLKGKDSGKQSAAARAQSGR